MKKIYFIFTLLLITTSAFAQQPYYSDINTELTTLTGIPLRDALATKIINTHSNSLDYTPDIWNTCEITDEDPNNSSNVVLIYGWENGSDGDTTNDLSRLKSLHTGGGSSVGTWNREHTFANSNADPDLDEFGKNGPPYSDAHNLRASDAGRNGQRGSLKFSSGSGNSSTSGGGWYPGDATTGGTDWRGDVARVTMYMYLRYGSQCLPRYNASGVTNSVDGDMINLLLDWNAADPVSSIEVARNTYHDSSGTYAQGNRNPFIDNPRLATIIWGGTPAEDIWGIYGGNDTQAPSVPTNLSVSNETSSIIDLDWTASTDDTAVTGYDIYVDGSYNSSSAANSHTVTGLSASTTYSFTVLAKDAANNMSAQSSPVNGTTLAGGGSGSTCITETFGNIPTGQSGYATRTWTGDDGGTWTATLSRTDQTINGPAITVRAGSLTSPSSGSGIGELTVTTHLVFSGSTGSFDLLVNGSSVGSIPYSSTETTTTISNINIEGSVTIVMDKSSSSNRVRIDDLTWTCYSTLGVEDVKLSNIKIYPNPTNGNDLYISTNQDLSVEVFNILGKQILTDSVSTKKTKIDVSSLNTGIYLIRLSYEDGSITRKFIKQ